MSRPKRIIVMGVASHYGHGVVQGIDSYSREQGGWEFYFGQDNSAEMVRQAEVALEQWKPDGIVAHIQSDRVERFVKSSGLPTVNVTGTKARDVPTVISDCEEIGRMGAGHFLENGFRNFGFSALTIELSVQKNCAGYKRALLEAGYGCSVFTWRYIGKHDFDWVKNRERLNRWLMSAKKPLALMCAYDPFAQMAVFACHHLGYRIPDDVAILGVGNEELYCRLSTPQLSSIELNTRRIGYEAARLLGRMMRNGKAPLKPILVPPARLIPRESTDIVRVDDPDIAMAVRYIRDHAHEPMGVKNLLAAIPVSRRLMEIRFLKTIGRTPSAELKRVRMEHARKLLFESDLSIPAVARNSGFSSARGFFATFRRMVGQTPTTYRTKSRLGGRA